MADDFGGASWRLEGLRELEQALVKLGNEMSFKTVKNRVLKESMLYAMQPVAEQMRANAPVQPEPRKSDLPVPLKDSVDIKFREPSAKDMQSDRVSKNTAALVAVGIRTSKKLKAQEFGTAEQTGHPFIRLALERNIQPVQTRLQNGLTLLINKLAQEQAKRTARLMKRKI